MRRLALLALLIPVLAAPAMAGQKAKLTVVKPAAAAKLRGAQPGSGAAVATSQPTPLATPVPAALAQAWSAPIPQGSGGDASQCRTSCARTYYFCAAGGDEDCAGRWSQCAASCTVTARAWTPAF